MAVIERVYTIPLRKAKSAPRYKRAKKAAKIVREFIARHMKTSEDLVWIDPGLNEYIWQRGAEKPPSRVRVFARKLDDGTVEVKLYEQYVKEQAEKAVEEKTREAVEEAVEEAMEEEKAEEVVEEVIEPSLAIKTLSALEIKPPASVFAEGKEENEVPEASELTVAPAGTFADSMPPTSLNSDEN